jgi:hypothetical protein
MSENLLNCQKIAEPLKLRENRPALVVSRPPKLGVAILFL